MRKMIVLAVVLSLITFDQATAETATFYADGYAGGITANGDTYDPGAFTAAHPSLPLGSVVDVCDVDNCITVTINDRCGCGIDLSRAAAAALFPLDQGVAEVSIFPH